jgi:hypothetical protein
MKRLLEEQRGPLEARAARLLEQTGPLEASEPAYERVRRALNRSAPPKRLGGSLRWAVVVFGLSASAAAVWGGARTGLFGFGDHGLADGVSHAAQAVEPHTVAHEAGPAEGREPAPAAPAPNAPESAHVASEVQKAAPSAQKVAKAAPKRAESSASDALLVQRAIEALRNERDPERANQLLEEYRAKGGKQLLAEEALALSIEAALMNDPKRAKVLAQQYQAKYPGGRFAQLAARALRAP